jgi:serine/threonine-protein kinase RsbW
MRFREAPREQNRGVQVNPLAGRSSVSTIRQLIRAELNEAGAPSSLAFDCLVAVTEACSNALLHGWKEEGSRNPEIEWEIQDGVARFEIRDYAMHETTPLDRKPTPPVQDERPVDERDGGYGLKMMRQLMDEVDIRFSTTGTTVLLVKYLHPARARSHS